MIINHASVFSGIGAAEIAATMLHWNNVFNCEINPFCRKILNYWFPKSKSYENIKKTNFKLYYGKIDVLTGGFPCQPFSYAGKRRGKEDDRYLWDEMLRVIQETKPTWFVGENVTGITTMVLPSESIKVGNTSNLFEQSEIYREEQSYVSESICKNLESEGYDVQQIIIPACAVGAPHRRDRIFFIAQNSNSLRCRFRELYKLANYKRQRQSSTTSKNGIVEQFIANTSSNRRRKIQQYIQSTKSNGKKFKCNGWRRIVANTSSNGLSKTSIENAVQTKKSSKHIQDYFKEYEKTRFSDKWRSFPSQSPVYRGNDGIPFDVDNLSIPFSKWRKETLKAYGNAIVPQVIYEIFKQIDNIIYDTSM